MLNDLIENDPKLLEDSNLRKDMICELHHNMVNQVGNQKELDNLL